MSDKKISKEKSIFKRTIEEVEELLNIWDNEATQPFTLGMEKYFNLSEKVKIAQQIIKTSENPRIIVLETWLIIDFTIRHLLTEGLELFRFQTNESSFLPTNTRDCINSLQEFIKDQRQKPINHTRNALKLPGEFFRIILADKDFFDKFLKYESLYNEELGVDFKSGIIIIDNPKYRNVADSWFKKVSKLDSKWFESINKINKVRNYAAHSFNEDKIYTELGINGKNKLDKLKAYCNNTLREIIGTK